MATSPICPEDFDKANFGGNTCDLLTQLLLTNDKLKQFFSWFFDEDCKISADVGAELVELLQPIGSGFWSPIPLVLDADVWVECDGHEILREKYPKLFAMFGTNYGTPTSDLFFKLPDLSGRMPISRGQRKVPVTDPVTPPAPVYELTTAASAAGLDSGLDKVVLTEDNLPEIVSKDHQHGMWGWRTEQDPKIGGDTDIAGSPWVETPLECKPFEGYWTDQGSSRGTHESGYNHVSVLTTEPIKTSDKDPVPPEAHNNMPPYWVGAYFMRANHKINGKIVP